MKRKCTKCGEEKPLTNEYFTKDKHDKSGFTYRCSKCRNAASYEWNRLNKDKVKEANLKNRDKRKDFYNEKSESQEGKCQICGKTEMNYKNKVLCVDHNHSTGQIRGLLCGLCNSGLGKFLEDKQLFINAIKYIEKYE